MLAGHNPHLAIAFLTNKINMMLLLNPEVRKSARVLFVGSEPQVLTPGPAPLLLSVQQLHQITFFLQRLRLKRRIQNCNR